MNIVESRYLNLQHQKHSLAFGNFYFFEKFIISEIAEGCVFDWSKAEKLLELATTYYGENLKNLVLISNRVNSYSLKLVDLLKFNKIRGILDFFIIVPYNDIQSNNIMLEKLFTTLDVKRDRDLEGAIIMALYRTKKAAITKKLILPQFNSEEIVMAS